MQGVPRETSTLSSGLVVSKKLVAAVKLDPRRNYVIAWQAQLHPTALSRLLNRIDRVKPGDPRVLRIAALVRVSPEEAFEETK
jgi:hypothetical protein